MLSDFFVSAGLYYIIRAASCVFVHDLYFYDSLVGEELSRGTTVSLQGGTKMSLSAQQKNTLECKII